MIRLFARLRLLLLQPAWIGLAAIAGRVFVVILVRNQLRCAAAPEGPAAV
jgi:hypothetical protein